MIIPVDLDGHLGTHVRAYCAACAFFGIFRECSEKPAFIKVIFHRDNVGGARILAVRASFAALSVYLYLPLHPNSDRKPLVLLCVLCG